MPQTPPRAPRVRTLEIPYRALVVRRDPTFEADKRKETEYEFSNGREFKANPTQRGAYADE